MKYIRTKDGRISYLSCEPNEEITDYEIITSKGTLTYRGKDEVIKIADTIEELCDEFVGVDKTNEHDRLSKLSLKSYCNYVAIYGAIWTDKGLIYVAKMNEKGELELI